MKSDLKRRLQSGEDLVGTMLTICDQVHLVNILKVCGFDFFLVDCEHGALDYGAVGNLLAMGNAAGLPGLVRIPDVMREPVLKYLEMGAAGLLLPNTESPEQAKRLVEYAKYAPLGNRGVSLLRPHTGYEKVNNAAEYMARANEQTLLMVQLESRRAVENASAIMAVEGVDAAFVGPSDLSQSLGIMGQLTHPDFIGAVDQVIAAARKHAKFSGLHVMGPADGLEPWIAKGMTLNLWANEVVLMMTAARDGMAKLKRGAGR